MPNTSSKETIFVGQLSFDRTEQDVRLMFEQFGTVVKCDLLRGANGRSKRCAFVTFTSTDHAAVAVERMDRSQTMEGRRRPLIVKFAESQVEKDQRRCCGGQQSGRPEPGGLQRTATGVSERNNASVEQWPANDDVNALSPEMLRQIGLNSAVTGASTAINNVNLQHLARNLLLTKNAAQLNPGLGHFLPYPTFTGYPQNPTIANLSVGNPFSGPAMIQTPISMTRLTASNPISPTVSTGPSSLSGPAQHPGQWPLYAELSAGTNPFFAVPRPFQAGLPLCYTATNKYDKKRHTEGSDGANLFVYNFPYSFTHIDLLYLFTPFGHVISASVYFDKATERSKCFGFVAYDNAFSAQAAIQALNSSVVGHRKITVKHKTAKEASGSH